MSKARLAITILAVLVMGAIIISAFLMTGDDPPAPADVQLPVPEAEPEAPVEEATRPAPLPPPPSTPEPVPLPVTEPAESLPELDESDAEARAELAEAIGEDFVERFLVDSGLVRKIVVTVDNLPREKVSMRLRAVPAIPGPFLVRGPEDAYELDEDNYARYRPFVRLVERADVPRLVAAYRRYYPLLQEAWEELGYPSSQFNDRLREVIAHLMAAPEAEAPIRLTRPNVLYEFADPGLQSLSAGQKMLVRMGPDNAQALKAKLRDVLAELP